MTVVITFNFNAKKVIAHVEFWHVFELTNDY